MPYLPALDGLRTLAVVGVVLYHLDVSWVPGGFLGVDLFFVISGFLITSLLLQQSAITGRISVGDFYRRRARRLLPALGATLIAVGAWSALVATDVIDNFRREVLAAAFYVSNWFLIVHQDSYFETFGRPSPLRHLWSLAVEEQFYLLWPALLIIGLVATRDIAGGFRPSWWAGWPWPCSAGWSCCTSRSRTRPASTSAPTPVSAGCFSGPAWPWSGGPGGTRSPSRFAGS